MEKKSNSSQNILNVILVIICAAIMGLFIYDYINKNNQISDLREESKNPTAGASTELKQQVEKLVELYKETSLNNATVLTELANNKNKTIIIKEDGTKNPTKDTQQVIKSNEQIKNEIAQNVAQNLAPIMNTLNKKQTLSNKKLDEIMNKLFVLLKTETNKSVKIRQEMQKAIDKERKREQTTANELYETQKVVAKLNGMVGEVKSLYIASHEEDSALGDIGRVVSAVPKFVKNTLTFDWFFPSDKIRAEKSLNNKQKRIMSEFEAIGNPEAMKRLEALKEEELKTKVIILKKYRKDNTPEPEIKE